MRPGGALYQDIWYDPASKLCGDGEDDGLVVVELLDDAADHLATCNIDDVVACAEGLESLDAPDDIVFIDGAVCEASELGDEPDELCDVNEATVAVAGGYADVDDLYAELVLPVSHAQHLCPPTALSRASEGVYTDRGAHLLESMAEGGIPTDGMAVSGGEAGEGGTKVSELSVEVIYLRL